MYLIIFDYFYLFCLFLIIVIRIDSFDNY